MNYIQLSELNKGNYSSKICVRVVRKWKYFGIYDTEKPIFIGLVLADAQGTAMYAEAPATEVKAIDTLLDLDKVYEISKFQVKSARLTYMPFDAKLMIQLGKYTAISVLNNPPAAIPDLIYKIMPFEEIKPLGSSTQKYLDVIGYITKVKKPQTIVPRGKDKVRILREVIIKDMTDTELVVTLWGDDATNFTIDHLYDKQSPQVIVALFLGCLPKNMFEEKLQVSAGYACRWFLNPNITEAQPFFTRFKNQNVYIEQDSEAPPQQQPPPTPLLNRSLADLNDMDPYDFPPQGSKCTVTVIHVPQNDNWWYTSCFYCKKSPDLQPDGGYICPKCKSSRTIPRYRLTFVVEDETAQATLFAFDDISTKLLHKECAELKNPAKALSGFPQELMALVSKKFIFAVYPADEKFSGEMPDKYRIDAIVDRSDRRDSPLSRLPAPASPLPLPAPPSKSLNIAGALDTSTTTHSDQTPPPSTQHGQLLAHKEISTNKSRKDGVQRTLFPAEHTAEQPSASTKSTTPPVHHKRKHPGEDDQDNQKKKTGPSS